MQEKVKSNYEQQNKDVMKLCVRNHYEQNKDAEELSVRQHYKQKKML